ncbi:MAG: GTPase HflX [Thermoplasmata archaeon]|nr:MAG: GTPase HflX [Thermoplasmata archaeon]
MSKTRCILISLDDDVVELRDLAQSLDFEVQEAFIQHRDKPDPRYFIGRGKANEIHDFVQKNDVDIAIINSYLKPSQQYNLEDYLDITVYDRIRLILEIFADRAHSEEARLQVELAKMEYEIPLLRDWIHKARYGERPGFMAGGEYEVAQYYEISRRRIKKIKQKLKKVEKEREIRRKQRRYKGYGLVSIAGYANAGKSTLFNLISEETVAVEDRLFTTLSTTTRKIPELKRSILLTDTVGFIEDLPHWLIEAFHSTLEEIFLSDVILLIMDASEPPDKIKKKLDTSFDILIPDLDPSKIILVFNKIDNIRTDIVTYHGDGKALSIPLNAFIQNPDDIAFNLDMILDTLLSQIPIDYEIGDIIAISAIDVGYKDVVLKSILKNVQYAKSITINIPNLPESQAFIGWLYSNCDIISIDYGKDVQLRIRHKDKDRGYITNKVQELGGRID